MADLLRAGRRCKLRPGDRRGSVSGHPEAGGITASTIYSYGFANFAGFPNTLDVELAILDAPVQTIYPNIDSYASLAAAGTLDAYGTGPEATVTVSGYGLTYTNPQRRFVPQPANGGNLHRQPGQPQHGRVKRPTRD
jgi:hypothetical protein